MSALDRASKPTLLKAKGAYQTCLLLSVEQQYFDVGSRRCEEWLSKKFPAEYHLIDEFRSEPTRVNSALDERPMFLKVNGQPYIGRVEAVKTPPATGGNANG